MPNGVAGGFKYVYKVSVINASDIVEHFVADSIPLIKKKVEEALNMPGSVSIGTLYYMNKNNIRTCSNGILKRVTIDRTPIPVNWDGDVAAILNPE